MVCVCVCVDGDFGEGGDVIWMDEVVCEGNERRLADCQHAGWAHHDCQPLENAKVQCTSMSPFHDNIQPLMPFSMSQI